MRDIFDKYEYCYVMVLVTLRYLCMTPSKYSSFSLAAEGTTRKKAFIQFPFLPRAVSYLFRQGGEIGMVQLCKLLVVCSTSQVPNSILGVCKTKFSGLCTKKFHKNSYFRRASNSRILLGNNNTEKMNGLVYHFLLTKKEVIDV